MWLRNHVIPTLSVSPGSAAFKPFSDLPRYASQHRLFLAFASLYQVLLLTTKRALTDRNIASLAVLLLQDEKRIMLASTFCALWTCKYSLKCFLQMVTLNPHARREILLSGIRDEETEAGRN